MYKQTPLYLIMIIVSSLKDLNKVCEKNNPSHLISVIDPGFEPITPNGVPNHLKLGLDDIIEIKIENTVYRNNNTNLEINDQVLPNLNHINKIIKSLILK